MAKMSDTATQIEDALDTQGPDAVATAIGVLQELPLGGTDFQYVTLEIFVQIAELWLEEQA